MYTLYRQQTCIYEQYIGLQFTYICLFWSISMFLSVNSSLFLWRWSLSCNLFVQHHISPFITTCLQWAGQFRNRTNIIAHEFDALYCRENLLVVVCPKISVHLPTCVACRCIAYTVANGWSRCCGTRDFPTGFCFLQYDSVCHATFMFRHIYFANNSDSTNARLLSCKDAGWRATLWNPTNLECRSLTSNPGVSFKLISGICFRSESFAWLLASSFCVHIRTYTCRYRSTRHGIVKPFLRPQLNK